MKKYFVLILILISVQLLAIKPKYSYRVRGNATDLIYFNQQLWVSTDMGVIEIFDTHTKRCIKTIKVPFYIDFMGDTVKPKIFDIDLNRSTNELSIVSQAEGGFSDVFIYKNNKLSKIIDKSHRYMIKKALFYKNKDLILGLLSNEILRFNIESKKVIYKTQISSYTFSDMVLSFKSGRIISSDESGHINILSSKDGKVILIYEGENLDNVYKIDYKGNCIATAGQDRRLGIYLFHPFSSYHIQSQFLIYAVALSPSGHQVAYLSDEDNDITLMNTKTKEKLNKLKGHSAVVNTMQFVSEHAMYSAADESKVCYWEF